MKQQCYMVNIYLNWVIVIGGLIFLIVKGDYVFALLWLILLPLALLAYIRVFPTISRYVGYGRVDDRPAQQADSTPAKVTLYTSLGCPFCPIVKRRLLALQKVAGFDLVEVDVTFKLDLLMGKGIHAVPVVEVGDRRLVGHATSEQLASLIHG